MTLPPTHLPPGNRAPPTGAAHPQARVRARIRRRRADAAQSTAPAPRGTEAGFNRVVEVGTAHTEAGGGWLGSERGARGDQLRHVLSRADLRDLSGVVQRPVRVRAQVGQRAAVDAPPDHEGRHLRPLADHDRHAGHVGDPVSRRATRRRTTPALAGRTAPTPAAGRGQRRVRGDRQFTNRRSNAGVGVADFPDDLVRTQAAWNATYQALAAPRPLRHRRPASPPAAPFRTAVAAPLLADDPLGAGGTLRAAPAGPRPGSRPGRLTGCLGRPGARGRDKGCAYLLRWRLRQRGCVYCCATRRDAPVFAQVNTRIGRGRMADIPVATAIAHALAGVGRDG
ncbi:hypothetical protein SHL15_0107 [Streptomyces hygroscopicus subsp. limoneus]|nr:hypothetical protein SHL15_0107 [Streptomyces hygroscopicus subsp. limoneus]